VQSIRSRHDICSRYPSSLDETFRIWKNVIRTEGLHGKHYDLRFSPYNVWIVSTIYLKKLAEIIINSDPNNTTLLKLRLIQMFFDYKLDIIWASKIIYRFIDFNSLFTDKNDLIMMQGLVKDMKKSKRFKDEWINTMYSIVVKARKGRIYWKNLANILGEAYGKLHIEDSPIFNTASRTFILCMNKNNLLHKSYTIDAPDNTKYNYNLFKEAFNNLKKEYINRIGRLAQPGVPINLELDCMFNYFYQVYVLRNI